MLEILVIMCQITVLSGRIPESGEELLHDKMEMVSRRASPLEATPGFEPGIKVLQTSALPLGYVATLDIITTLLPYLQHILLLQARM